MSELTDEQIEKIDALHNGVYNLVADLLGYKPKWDIEWIGSLSAEIADTLVKHFDKTEMEVYPYIEESE